MQRCGHSRSLPTDSKSRSSGRSLQLQTEVTMAGLDPATQKSCDQSDNLGAVPWVAGSSQAMVTIGLQSERLSAPDAALPVPIRERRIYQRPQVAPEREARVGAHYLGHEHDR